MPVAVNEFLKKSFCSVANLADRMGLRWEAHAEKLCKWLKIDNLALKRRRQTAPFAATATCASETVPALAKSQTAAAEA